jgi:SAM-dependent methyltransferase
LDNSEKTLEQQRVELYTSFVKDNGSSSAGVGWHNPNSQQIRFDLIKGIMDEYHVNHSNWSNEKPIVVDAGCGFGDLYKTLYLDYQYVGIDENPEVLEVAMKKHPFADFHRSELSAVTFPKCDWIVFSGVFTALWDKDLIIPTLKNAFESASVGVIFNMLDEVIADSDSSKTSNHFNAFEVLNSIHTGISRNLIYRHDYLYHDFTIAIMKNYG